MCSIFQSRNMQHLVVIVLLFGTINESNATNDTDDLMHTPGCWWTGCQSTLWAVHGCNQEGMEERKTLKCEDGNRYQCCPSNMEPTTTPIPKTDTDNLMHTPGCWWTGCQPNIWAVHGCNQDGMEERKTLKCEDGNRYLCCPSNMKPTTTPIPKTDTDNLMHTPGCWWTGCQSNLWAVHGCNQDGMEERKTLKCEDGNRYQCCPSNMEPTTTPIPKTDTDNLMHTPGCWWTGCQSNLWAVHGCNQGGMEERKTLKCDDGNRYLCCPSNMEPTTTPIPKTDTDNLMHTPGCWWTGCQSTLWAVHGCNQDGMEERKTLKCEDGNRYQCCPSYKESSTSTTETESSYSEKSVDEFDLYSGMSYLNLAKYLIAKNPIFNLGERLSCPLLDPNKKFLVKFGNYVVPACDLCPSFNQRLYRNRLLHQDPVRTLSNIDFSECFGACVHYSSECVALSHDSNEQTCYHFDSTEDARMSTENGYYTVLMTQPKGQVREWSYTRNTKLNAENITQTSSKTFQDCMAMCEENRICRAVSYDFNSSICSQFSDLNKTDLSLTTGIASGFKQSAFRSKSAKYKFKLLNDDLLSLAIAEYQIPNNCANYTNNSTGAFYKPYCLGSSSTGCIPGTKCKSCYYPERISTIESLVKLEICPDSTSAKAKYILGQIEKFLEECLQLENCFAVTLGTKYINPTFITAANAKKMSDSSILYVLKNFHNNYNLIPSAKLKRSNVQTAARDYLLMNASSLSDCVKNCDSQSNCNRFSYVGETKSCTLSSADGVINLTDEGSEEVVAIRDFPISYTGNRYTEIPGYTASPETDGKDLLTTRDCDSNCYQSCQNVCNAMPTCKTIVMSQTGNKVRCHLYSSGDLVMETEDFARILRRVSTVNISREFLDILPSFQSSDLIDCFQNSDHRTQSSLDPDLELSTDVLSVDNHLRAKRGFFDFIGDFFNSAINTVVETVKGVADDIGHTLEATGKFITGDLEGAAEAIQEVGIIQDGINVVKSVGSLVQGDLEGAAEHFRDISYVQSVEDLAEIGKAVIDGDWKKVADLSGEAAAGIAGGFVPVVGRGGKRGKRRKKTNIDDEIKKEHHSEERSKRATDREERKHENEQEGKKKQCKRRSRRRRATTKTPSKNGCEEQDANINFCPAVAIRKVDNNNDNSKKKKSKPKKKPLKRSVQCKGKRKGETCDYECEPGFEEQPDSRVRCILQKENQPDWNREGQCAIETCTVGGIRNLIVLSTPKPKSSVVTDMTAYIVLYNAERKIPIWSVALHDSKQFGKLYDYTGLDADDVFNRTSSFLKHPCPELHKRQANYQAYNKQWWQKGHLTPARVIRWSRKASRSVNLFINVAPQDPITNERMWKWIEDNAFCTAKRLRSIIATGTCDDEIEKMKGVSVPTCFWKMICYVREGEHHVVGFIADNRKLNEGDDRGIAIRLLSALNPRDQIDVIREAGISPHQNPFLLSAPYLFKGRSILQRGKEVMPAMCAKQLFLSRFEKKDWSDGLRIQREFLGKRKRPEDESQRPVDEPQRSKRSKSGKACCSLDEMRIFFDSNDEDEDSDHEDSDEDDVDEDIESTESLVSAESCGKRIVGYFTSWGKYKFSPRQAQRLTHVIFAFLETQENGEVKIGCVDPAHSDCSEAEELAEKRLSQLLRIANQFEHLNVMFAVGGWENSQYFSSIAASPQRRLVFIASLIQTIKKYNFDGVDLDWEYPATGGAVEGVAEDKANYVTLLTELRTALDNLSEMERRERKYLISIAGAAGQWTLDPGYDIKGIVKQLDFINVMTYDYFGAWESKWGAYTGPPAPLYFGMPKGFSGKTNVAWTTKYYACRSREPHKINMGVPFYGRYWENVGNAVDDDDPMWRKADGEVFKGGAYGWRDVKQNLSSGIFGEIHFHEKTKSKYAYNPSTKLYLGLEDSETLRHKVDFAVSSNLGGIMIWAIDQDDDELTMLNTAYEADLCSNTNPTDIQFKCLPTEEQLWWTPENSDENSQGRCGEFDAPLIHGRYPACDPDDPGYSCCSDSGYCGSGTEFCDCAGCVNHAKNPDRLLEYARIPTTEELQFREICKPNWENGCKENDECCSRFCFMGNEPNKWAIGQCRINKKGN